MRLSLLLIAFVLLCSSCARQRMYFADPAPTFGFREKGQIKAYTSAKLQGNSYSTNDTDLVVRARGASLAADVGYAITDRWGVYGSYRDVSRTSRAAREGGYGIYTGRRAEGGAVYYTRVGRSSTFEGLVGGGAGHLRCDGFEGLASYDMHYWRASLQGAIAYQPPSDALRVYGGLRLTFQQTTRFSSTDANLRYTLGQPENLAGPGTVFGRDIIDRPLGLLEPFAGLETGYRWVRIVSQSGFSSRYFGPRPGGMQFYISFGIGFQWPGGPVPGRAAAD